MDVYFLSGSSQLEDTGILGPSRDGEDGKVQDMLLDYASVSVEKVLSFKSRTVLAILRPSYGLFLRPPRVQTRIFLPGGKYDVSRLGYCLFWPPRLPLYSVMKAAVLRPMGFIRRTGINRHRRRIDRLKKQIPEIGEPLAEALGLAVMLHWLHA